MDYDNHNFIRLLESDGTWDAFETDWRSQCDSLGEEFDSYAEATFAVVRDLIREENRTAGVFALQIDGVFVAMCQVNKAGLPRYDSPVMRVRFITLSPEYDLTDKQLGEYAEVLVSLLMQVLQLAYMDEELQCMHLKFHLRSPADIQFFAAFGAGLSEKNLFKSIKTAGAWLHITRK